MLKSPPPDPARHQNSALAQPKVAFSQIRIEVAALVVVQEVKDLVVYLKLAFAWKCAIPIDLYIAGCGSGSLGQAPASSSTFPDQFDPAKNLAKLKVHPGERLSPEAFDIRMNSD
jgi:hypothetical protein